MGACVVVSVRVRLPFNHKKKSLDGGEEVVRLLILIVHSFHSFVAYLNCAFIHVPRTVGVVMLQK